MKASRFRKSSLRTAGWGWPRGPGSGWLATGILAGLALHTHPSVIVFLVALAIWFMLDSGRRAQLRTRWPWLSVGAALIAYSPMIVYNLTTGFDSITQARASTNVVTEASTPGWLAGVGALLGQLGRSMSGGFGLDGPEASGRWIGWLYVLVVLAAVGWSAFAPAAHEEGAVDAARGNDGLTAASLPAVITLVSVAGLPLFNANWHGFLEARYLAFLLPVLYAALAVCIPMAWVRVRVTPPARGGIATPLLALLVVLVAFPAWRVLAYDRHALDEQFDNRRLIAMAETAQAASGSGASILVDAGLKEVRWRAGGHPRRAMEYLLLLANLPFTTAPEDKINHLVGTGGDYLLFLAGPTADRISARYPLQPIDTQPRPREGPWGLYRSGSRSGAQSGAW